MKLKLGLQRVGSIVFGRVLEQDESLRNCEDIISTGKVISEMLSAEGPELYSDSIFIMGDCLEQDNDWFAFNYEDEETAIQAVKDIRALVKMVNSEDCGLEIIE